MAVPLPPQPGNLTLPINARTATQTHKFLFYSSFDSVSCCIFFFSPSPSFVWSKAANSNNKFTLHFTHKHTRARARACLSRLNDQLHKHNSSLNEKGKKKKKKKKTKLLRVGKGTAGERENHILSRRSGALKWTLSDADRGRLYPTC